MVNFKNFSNIFKRTLMVSTLGIAAITLSGCKQDESFPFDLGKEYLKVAGEEPVTYGEVWNELKWSAVSLFDDKKNEAVLSKYLEEIKNKDHERHSEDVKRLKNYLIEDVHNLEFSFEDHQEEIDKLDEKTKEKNYRKYADEVYKNHKVELTTEEIYNCLKNNDLDGLSPLYKLYYLDLAKELHAKDMLNREIAAKDKEAKEAEDEEDKVGYFSKSEIINKYRNDFINKGDVEVIMIKFASEAEALNTLRSFGIKTHNGKFYFIPGYDKDNNNQKMTFSDYKTYYDDFSFEKAKDDEYIPLDAYYGNSIILQLYVAMYNYIYTYRNVMPNTAAGLQEGNPYKGEASVQPSTTIDNRSITESLTKMYDEFKDDKIIKDKPTDEARVSYLMNNILTNNEEFVKYTSKEIEKIDPSLHSYIYKDLSYKAENEWVPKESDANRYSTEPKSIGDAYYMVFKYNQVLEPNDELNYNEWKPLNDDELFDTLDKPANLDLKNLIIDDLKKEKITSSYIDDKMKEKLDSVSVSIYNKEIEIAYSVSNPDYSKTLSSADSNTLAKFEYEYEYEDTNETETGSAVLNVSNEEGTGAWDILDYRTGVFVASKLLSDKMIKKTDAYAKIEKKEIDNYYRSIEYILASFANDGLAQQGYPASIGKYNFLMLYYHTADIDQIVDNVFKVAKASSELLIDYSNDKIISEIFEPYTNRAYNNFFSLTTKNLQVFMDRDEDGKPDKSFNFNDTISLGDFKDEPFFKDYKEETVSYAKLAESLISKIYDLLLNSNQDYAASLDTIVTKYNQSSRFNPKTGSQWGEENYDPIGSEWLFSKYKKLGFAIKADELVVTNTSYDIDMAVREKLSKIYNENLKDKKYLQSYLEDAHENGAILKLENNTFNYYAITKVERTTSAKYEASKDPKEIYKDIKIMYNNEIVKIPSIYNDNDMLSVDQIKAYIIEKLAYETSSLLPTDISQSLTNYCDPVLTRFLDTTTQAEIVYKYVSNNNQKAYEFDDNRNTRFENLRHINQTIADNYIDDNENEKFNNFHGWWEAIENLEFIGGTK